MRFIERIYGIDKEHESCYLTRIMLTPKTRWGGLLLHIFHRGDADPDPHDHPWDFWTLPLSTYLEQTLTRDGLLIDVVPRLRWTHRQAEHAHRVLGAPTRREGQETYGLGGFISLVWHGPKRRRWYFWVMPDDPKWIDVVYVARYGGRAPVWWRDYVFGESNE